jgi:hypothetical protein
VASESVVRATGGGATSGVASAAGFKVVVAIPRPISSACRQA